MRRAPVPGEAALDPAVSSLAVLRNVALGVVGGQQRVDAVLDTGATYCVVPVRVSGLLGFGPENRLGEVDLTVVGGRKRFDRHALEYVRVGTATVYRVEFLAGDVGPRYSPLMLLGLSFISNFTTTLDWKGRRVLFR
jgi:predicted aspartyl protease